ncbi:MAG: oligopeptide transporter, OPT family [Arcanobacterium sp.]|nr:oligopeptide transporter, OPT family [Arcanobacterium sp.]MDY5589722.1 oligopeptide transporter, OPT family [Arcanobacterium sp.]
MTQQTKPRSSVKELTIRAVIIGGLITLVFTAANAYLGLKVGLTFATSIPAAVISMAALRKFADHTVVENNIVQTIASAAGTLSAIIFVLPGLVMVGYWSGFPFWETTAVTLVGGILGVTYSIPLRRALVTGSDLPYPEGVAAAEVLKVGDTNGSAEENHRGLLIIIWGGIASAGYGLLAAMKAVAGSISVPFRVGAGATMVGGSLSLALMGVGHLVGPAVGLAMAVGFVLAYGILLPVLTVPAMAQGGDLADIVGKVFSSDVRMIGAGAMAVAAVWTLLKIIGPIIKGIKESLASSKKREAGETLPITEQDIPFKYVALITLVSMIPIGILLWLFLQGSPISHHTGALIMLSIIFVLLIGLIVASICGYMAGLIGASNSPISGVGIIVVVAAALLILFVTGNEAQTHPTELTAYTLFTTAIVFGIATISNDNLQDLKTGQLVGATPWKQQVALIIGVVFGSIVIPPVLQLLMNSFGFLSVKGELIGPAGGDVANALQAPQATLLSAISSGIFGGSMQWNLFGIGAIIGVVVVIVDEILGKTTKYHLAPLAVGMGMYLNISTTLMVAIGAFTGFAYDRWAAKQANPERSKRYGVLLATGLIVGDSLFGILNAALIGASGNPDFLGVIPDSFGSAGKVIGLILFIAVVVVSYRWVKQKSNQPLPSELAAHQ